MAYEVLKTPRVSKVSTHTVYRVLRANKFSCYKRTVKLGLTLENKAARLKWCLDYENWTLKDWKNVIWTNETSVQLRAV
jgi:hypothetical protein